MTNKNLAEVVKQIQIAFETDDEDKALHLARAIAPQALVLNGESEAVWELAELLILLEDEQLGLKLAARQVELGKTDNAFVQYASLLSLADQNENAVKVLREIIAERGANCILVAGLVELALAGLGWEILDNLDIADSDVLKMLDDVRQRSANFDISNLDSRRQAYILAKMIILGASEDESDFVEPYWFLNADEFEVAWFLRRLVMWMQKEKVQSTSVRPGDPAAMPIALALAQLLGIQFITEPPDVPGGICIFSMIQSLENVKIVYPNDRLTISLGVGKAPGWKELVKSSPVDIVGVVAPVTISWSSGDIISSVSLDTEPIIEVLDANRIALNILEEERKLPNDKALPKILRFYKQYGERIRHG